MYLFIYILFYLTIFRFLSIDLPTSGIYININVFSYSSKYVFIYSNLHSFVYNYVLKVHVLQQSVNYRKNSINVVQKCSRQSQNVP